MPDEIRHEKSDIYIFLKKSFFAVFSFKDKDEEKNEIIKSELMIFNTTDSGDFYLTLRRPDTVFKSIDDNKDVTLLIYKEAEDLQEISRVVIEGEAKIIYNKNSENAIFGFRLIGERSPRVRHLLYEDEVMRDEYSLIFVKSKTINFISMKEIAKGIEPTLLARK